MGSDLIERLRGEAERCGFINEAHLSKMFTEAASALSALTADNARLEAVAGQRMIEILEKENEAADEITALRERVAELEAGLKQITMSGIHRETKWFGMTAADIARALLANRGGANG